MANEWVKGRWIGWGQVSHQQPVETRERPPVVLRPCSAVSAVRSKDDSHQTSAGIPASWPCGRPSETTVSVPELRRSHMGRDDLMERRSCGGSTPRLRGECPNPISLIRIRYIMEYKSICRFKELGKNARNPGPARLHSGRQIRIAIRPARGWKSHRKGLDRSARNADQGPALRSLTSTRSARRATLAGRTRMRVSRRTLLKGSAAATVIGGLGAPLVARAAEAEFTYKYRQQPAGHPSAQRARPGDVGGRIKAETNGRVDIQIFPEQPARLRHRHAEPDPLRRRRVLHAVRPDPGDAGAGGRDQRHRLRVPRLRRRCGRRWTASSAPMSAARSPRPISWPMDKIWDNGFRQITSSTRPINGPEDLKGFKIRVPVVAAVDLDVQGVRCSARLDQFQRGLFGAADQGGRRPGKSAGASSRPPSSTKCRSTAR